MRTRRSKTQVSSDTKILHFDNRDTIPYVDTCVSLNFDSATACEVCASKIDILCKASSRKKNKFRHTSHRNRCEQRWSLNYISGLKTSNNRYLTHIDVCEKLGIEPYVRLENNEIVFSSNFASNEKKKLKTLHAKVLPSPIVNPTIKSPSIASKTNLPTLTRKVTPDFRNLMSECACSQNILSSKTKITLFCALCVHG